jgi:hypothetical protein
MDNQLVTFIYPATNTQGQITNTPGQLQFIRQTVIQDTETDATIYVKEFINIDRKKIDLYPMQTLSSDGFIQFKTADELVLVMSGRKPDFCTSEGFYDIFIPDYSYILTNKTEEEDKEEDKEEEEEVVIKERIIETDGSTSFSIQGNNNYKLLIDSDPASLNGQYKTCVFQKAKKNRYRVKVSIPMDENEDRLTCQMCGKTFNERGDDDENQYCLNCYKILHNPKQVFFTPKDASNIKAKNRTRFEVMVAWSIHGHGGALRGAQSKQFENTKPCISMNRIGVADTAGYCNPKIISKYYL